MAKVNFSLNSQIPAERVLAVATDFSDNRPRYWPNIDPKVYKVHGKAATSADVTEGSAILGGVWAREAYDWSEPQTVRAVIQESNVYRPGGVWQLRAIPLTEGGCRIEVFNHREAWGFKGRVIGAMLSVMGSRVLPKQLQQTLDIITKDKASHAVPGAGAAHSAV